MLRKSLSALRAQLATDVIITCTIDIRMATNLRIGHRPEQTLPRASAVFSASSGPVSRHPAEHVDCGRAIQRPRPPLCHVERDAASTLGRWPDPRETAVLMKRWICPRKRMALSEPRENVRDGGGQPNLVRFTTITTPTASCTQTRLDVVADMTGH